MLIKRSAPQPAMRNTPIGGTRANKLALCILIQSEPRREETGSDAASAESDLLKRVMMISKSAEIMSSFRLVYDGAFERVECSLVCLEATYLRKGLIIRVVSCAQEVRELDR
jgi:hypothetical protein